MPILFAKYSTQCAHRTEFGSNYTVFYAFTSGKLVQYSDSIEDDDPVVVFCLSPSEHIHECLQLPHSPIPAGATPQDYIHNTKPSYKLASAVGSF